MHNVLLIAYVFPPIPYAGTYRSMRLCKYFDYNSINLHVLTINIYDEIPNDYNLLKNIPNSVKIHRTPIFDPWRKFQAWKDKSNRLGRFKTFNRIISTFLRPLNVPDHMVFWIINAFPTAIKIITRNNISKVIVSSPPNSALILGLLLKKTLKIKLISDLRDPIVGNVFEVDFNTSSDLITNFERKFRKLLRNLVIDNSDIVVTTTETHRQKLIYDFPGKKIATIHNSYDNDDFSNPSKITFNKFTISHIGSVVRLRNVNGLFAAIKLLEKYIQPHVLNLQVLFYGMNSPHLTENIDKFRVEKFCKVYKLIPHVEAIDIMKASHLLLLLKAIGSNALDHLPAKLFEYIGAQKSILYIGPQNSEAASIIKNNDIGYITENDSNNIFRILKKEYSKFLTNKIQDTHFKNPEIYSSKTMTHNFFSLINDIDSTNISVKNQCH